MRWVDGFWSPGIDSSGEQSAKCLKPSEEEASTFHKHLVTLILLVILIIFVQKSGKPVLGWSNSAIFFWAVEDAFEDDTIIDGRDYLPGSVSDGTLER